MVVFLRRCDKNNKNPHTGKSKMNYPDNDTKMFEQMYRIVQNNMFAILIASSAISFIAWIYFIR